MESTYSSEMSVDFQRTIRRYIPEDNNRCENLKSCILTLLPVALYGCETWYLPFGSTIKVKDFLEKGAEENTWT
jgi:hypothetical protein